METFRRWGEAVDKRDVEAANGIFNTPETRIKLFPAALYLQQLLNVRSPSHRGLPPGRPLPKLRAVSAD